MKDEICKAFCGAITVREVPIGLAVGTAFRGEDGDKIGFYVIRDPGNRNRVRIEDDGMTIPMLEASGVDISEGPRAAAFLELLADHGVEHDIQENLLHTAFMTPSDGAQAALRFVAFLLRVQDFFLISRENVERTFKTDVIRALTERFSGRAEIVVDGRVNEQLADFPADAVVRPRNGDPLAIFIGTSENKALEAMLFWMYTHFRTKLPYKCMLILETAKPRGIKERTLARAMNSFPVAVFGGEQQAAMDAAERRIYGQVETVH